MYRDDDTARAARASALIDEIAALERRRLEHAATDQRLETARRALAELQAPPPAPPDKPPGVLVHLLVFAATAAAAAIGYGLLP